MCHVQARSTFDNDASRNQKMRHLKRLGQLAPACSSPIAPVMQAFAPLTRPIVEQKALTASPFLEIEVFGPQCCVAPMALAMIS